MGTKSVSTRTDSQRDANTELNLRLEHYDTTLRSIEVVAADLRQQVFDTLAGGSATGFMDEVRNMLDRGISLLNSRLGGRYVFSGTLTDTMPVNISNEADLLALPATANAFDNNQIKAQVKVDQSQTMSYGVLADDVGEPLFEAFRRIMQFNSGTLPTGAGPYAPAGTFNSPLDDNQRQFLINELSRLETVVDGLNDIVAQNGINMRTVEKINDRLDSEKTFLTEFISDIEDVDVAEAISRLQQDQLAVEASYQVLADLNDLTLMDFI
jgi:flagellar hook-associated protein 3 FlgL